MFHVRFLVVACCILVNPTFGWNPWKSEEIAQLYVQPTPSAVKGRGPMYADLWKQIISKFDGPVVEKYGKPLGMSCIYGSLTVLTVKIIIWLFGFDNNGVRKDTIASYYVRRQGGHVLAGSWLAIGQSLGASGLGLRLGSIIFFLGAAVANMPNRNATPAM